MRISLIFLYFCLIAARILALNELTDIAYTGFVELSQEYLIFPQHLTNIHKLNFFKKK